MERKFGNAVNIYTEIVSPYFCPDQDNIFWIFNNLKKA